MSKPDKTKEIRELRALVPENNLCINCQSKSPGYVCLTFSTFVCTKCAGVHRSLMHNIRSITLSTLTDAEMELMRAGGNAVAQQVWLANWNESQNPRPNPEDEAALRKFIRSAFVDEIWKSGGLGSGARTQGPTALDMGNAFNFDLAGSYAASPPTSTPNFISAIPLQPVSVGATPTTAPSLLPIDLPLESPVSVSAGHYAGHSAPTLKASGRGLDLISWDEHPDAGTMPTSVVLEEAPRRPVYQVQHSSVSLSEEHDPPRTVPLSSPPTIQNGTPKSQNGDISAELQIKQLQDLLQAQQRQFQHQMQQQQLKEQQLQQQLQQTRMHQQMKDGQVMLQQKLAGSPPPGTMSVSPPPASHFSYTPAAQGGAQVAGGVRYGSPGSVAAPIHGLSGHATANGAPIMVLGPNGQLVPLGQPQTNIARSTVQAPSSVPTASNAAPQLGMSFTPLVNANGTAVMAPPASPLMTLGASATPSSLPPGSIGPHYVPAPGGGYQAVYMVPSGTLPPGAATNKAVSLPSGVQPAHHHPVTYNNGKATGHRSVQPTGSPQGYPGAAPQGYPGLAGSVRAPAYPAQHSENKQEMDDFALALKLQQEEEAAAERELNPQRSGAAPRSQPRAPVASPPANTVHYPSYPQQGTGPNNTYFQDSLLANASYIANDEELARQLAAAELSDDD
jgi:hypothetical protein